MDAVIMLALRIGLLALLWIFILVALNAMRRQGMRWSVLSQLQT